MNYFTLFLFIFVFLDFVAGVPVLDEVVAVRNRRKELHERGRLGNREVKEKLLVNCQKKKNKCRGQTEDYKHTRNQIKTSLLNSLQNENSNITFQEADQQIENRLQKIYELKKKIHEHHGLSDIDPADDGLWQGDIVLTSDQADRILKNLENPRPIFKSPAEKMRVQKRSAVIYFEDAPKARWTMPVHYWVSDDFTTKEKDLIDAALQNITSTTGCIKFKKDKNRYKVGRQIQYVKSGTGCSGNSPIGVGLNEVRITATDDWCVGDVLKGLVIHETIHSLGGDHEQSRADRDDYIKILFENIDPQKIIDYDKDVATTSYGVPYDYESIMHYVQGTFQVAPGLNTMEPNVRAILGSNYLSAKDILQLKRMYCKPSSCVDTDQECGTWAIDNWCLDPDWAKWMKKNCSRSCGIC